VLISQLRMRNWACHAALDLTFKPGLNGILGENGSGKSSVLDALRFAVTGYSIAGGQRADNVRVGQKSGYAEVEFAHGDKAFTIRRHAESSKSKLVCDGETMTRASDIEELIEATLQTKIDALLNNVFVGQNALDDILFKTNTERLKEFQETFGLTRMAEAYRVLSNEIASCVVTPGLEPQRDLLVNESKEARKMLDAARAELAALETTIADLMKVAERAVAHEAAVQLREASERGRALADQLALDIAKLQGVMSLREMAIGEIGVKTAAVAADVATAIALVGQYKLVQAQRQALTAELEKLTALQAPAVDIPGAQAALARESDRFQKLSAIAKGEMPLPKVEEDTRLETQLAAVVEKLTALRASSIIDVLRSTVDREEKVLKACASGTCPTCHRGMDNWDPARQQSKIDEAKKALAEAVVQQTAQAGTLEAEKADLKRQIDLRQTAALAAVKQALAASGKAKDGAQRALDQAQPAVAVYEAARRRKVDVEAQLAALPVILAEDVVKAEEVVRENTERLDRLTKLRALQAADNSTLTALTAERKRTLDNLPAVDAGLILSPEEYTKSKAAEVELQKLFGTKRDIETRIGISDAKLSAHTAAIEQLNQKIAQESKSMRWSALCSKARDVIHVNGLPALMMREYALRINRRMAHYLQVWEAPFRLQLDDTLADLATLAAERKEPQ